MTTEEAREIVRLADLGVEVALAVGTHEGLLEAGVHAQATAVAAVLGHYTPFAGLEPEDRRVLAEVDPRGKEARC